MPGALQRLFEHGAQLRFVFDQKQGFHKFSCITISSREVTGHAVLCGVRYRSIPGCPGRTGMPATAIYGWGVDPDAGAGCAGGVAHPGSPPAWRNSSWRLSMSDLSCSTSAVFSSILVFVSF